jgi:hypothetical protein
MIDSADPSLRRLLGRPDSASERYGRLERPNGLDEPHRTLLSLDAIQRLPLRSCRVGHGQINAGGKLEP